MLVCDKRLPTYRSVNDIEFRQIYYNAIMPKKRTAVMVIITPVVMLNRKLLSTFSELSYESVFGMRYLLDKD